MKYKLKKAHHISIYIVFVKNASTGVVHCTKYLKKYIRIDKNT